MTIRVIAKLDVKPPHLWAKFNSKWELKKPIWRAG